MEGTPEQLAAREKLREKHTAAARTGGKGSARLVRRRPGGVGVAGGRAGGAGGAGGPGAAAGSSPAGEERKVMAIVRKMGLSDLPQMDDVIFYQDNGQAMIFNQPKVQAALNANTFVVTGFHEVKPTSQIRPLAPEIDAETLKRIADEFQKLQKKAAAAAASDNKTAAGNAAVTAADNGAAAADSSSDGAATFNASVAAAIAEFAGAGTSAAPAPGAAAGDDDIPELVDNFETVD